MAEVWAPIPGYENYYEASDQGRVRRLNPRSKGDGILIGDIDHKGYRRVLLSVAARSKRFFVHRLVCATFRGPPPPGTECGHRNGDKTDNRLENLEWISRSQNTLDAIKHGTHLWVRGDYKSDHQRHTRISLEKIQGIREGAAGGLSTRMLAEKFGVSQSHVSRILNGQARGGLKDG